MQFDHFVLLFVVIIIIIIIIISSYLAPLNSIISAQLLCSCLRQIFHLIHEQKEVLKII